MALGQDVKAQTKKKLTNLQYNVHGLVIGGQISLLSWKEYNNFSQKCPGELQAGHECTSAGWP